MFSDIRALVLREVKYKEADRILTLLTDSGGKMTVKARGALRKGSRLTAATQQLTYSEMTLFGNREKWTVNEAVTIEGFSGLRSDISSLALGSYFAECTEAMAVEDEPDAALMQLTLNSLYALSRGLYNTLVIKAAFELRLMSVSGYTPKLDCCAVCGKPEAENAYLSLSSGTLCCASCRSAAENTVHLGNGALAAARYILSAPPKRLFSFTCDEETIRELSFASEKYLLRQTERSFASLEYWKKIR